MTAIASPRPALPRAVLVQVPSTVWLVLMQEVRVGSQAQREPLTAVLAARLSDDLWGVLRVCWPDPAWRRAMVVRGKATWRTGKAYRCRPVVVTLPPAAAGALEAAHGNSPALSLGRFAGLLLAQLYALPPEAVDAAAAARHRLDTAASKEVQEATEMKRWRESTKLSTVRRLTVAQELPPPAALRGWREALGLSRREAAAQFGVSPSMVDVIERVRRKSSGPRTLGYVDALRTAARTAEGARP